jgi:hypothetical protein
VDHTAQALITVSGFASGTTMHFSVLDGNTGRSIGDYMDVVYASLSRCPLVAGAGQTGTSLVVYSLPTSTPDLLSVGDQFEIVTSRGSELKIVTAPVDGDAGSGGLIRFVPPLRGTVADNSPIILQTPMSRYVSVGQVPEWSNEPGFVTRISMDLEESQ